MCLHSMVTARAQSEVTCVLLKNKPPWDMFRLRLDPVRYGKQKVDIAKFY
jgi:hypothetical protein